MPTCFSSVKNTYLFIKEKGLSTITPKMVATELNISSSLAYQCLYQLKGRGIVDRDTRGRYSLTEAGQARTQYDEQPIKKSFKIFKYPVEIWPIHKYLWYVQRSCFKRAQNKGIEYELQDGDLEKIWDYQDGRCVLTGIPMTTVRGNGWQVPTNASCDRINPGAGYVEGNVRLLCFQANTMRGQLTDEELVIFCKLIFNKSNGTNGSRNKRE